MWSRKLSDYSSSEKSADVPAISTSKLNIFVGANNSGKSRLLRNLFISERSELMIEDIIRSENINKELFEIRNCFNQTHQLGNLTRDQVVRLFAGGVFTFTEYSDSQKQFSALLENIKNGTRNGFRESEKNYLRQLSIFYKKKLNDENFFQVINELINPDFPKKYYIPVLRGMRPLLEKVKGEDDFKDLYFDRTKKDYFKSQLDPGENEIITGVELYKLLTKHLLGQPNERKLIRDYEILIGEWFFGGEDFVLVPEYNLDTVAVKIGSEKQRPIYDLGDGLQQIIIITSAAFLQRKESLFFIEEPENHMHPGMLRKLVLFLLEQTPHQYFFTTHSNHLLDLAELRDDVVIQKVTKVVKDNKAEFKIRQCTRDRDLLTDLGVKASSVYLSNSSIWVEGITDRFYLSVYMKKYIESLNDEVEKKKLEGLIENYHYSFVEYQGSTLGHWAFTDGGLSSSEQEPINALKLCSEALLIADGDIYDKGDRENILNEQLGKRFLMLNCKEIENLIPSDVLKETAIRTFNGMQSGTKEKLDINALDGVANSNYSASMEGVGYHLDQLFGLDCKIKGARRVFAESSGTIKRKGEFCKKAIIVMGEIEWELTNALNELCKKIFDHILSCNQE